MALFRYLRPVGKALDPQGPLSEVVPSAVIREVNLEVQKAGGGSDEEARTVSLIYRGGEGTSGEVRLLRRSSSCC